MSPDGRVKDINDIEAFFNKHEQEYPAKKQELQDWLVAFKSTDPKNPPTIPLSKVVITSNFPDTFPKSSHIAVAGEITKIIRKSEINGTKNNWCVGDFGSRWLDCEVENPNGCGKFDVRVAFFSKKFGEVRECEECDANLSFTCDFIPEICVLCHKDIKEGWGNNPFPVKEKGECCDTCNREKVIPARLKVIKIGKEGRRTTDEEFIKGLEALGDIEIPVYVPKKAVKKVTQKDIAEQIQKTRKEAEQKAKLEAETERLKAEVKRLKEEKKMVMNDAKITITINVSKNGEDDEAKEIRRRAKEVKVKVKTKNGGK